MFGRWKLVPVDEITACDDTVLYAPAIDELGNLKVDLISSTIRQVRPF